MSSTRAASTTDTPFQLGGSQFNMASYMGRVGYFFDLISPARWFITSAKASAAAAALDTYKKTGAAPAGMTDADMWKAQSVYNAVYHPDTGLPIPLATRMYMFMPVNLPITAGMLLSGPGGAQLFWQWMNQSYNAAFNYGNRNATVPVDYRQLALSYGIATGTALSAAWGLGKVVQRVQASLGTAKPTFGFKLLQSGIPWLAVATAGTANALAMRYKEGVDGINVTDEHGTDYGKSVVAGRTVLLQIALTRIVLPIPVLLMPPFALDAVRAIPAMSALMARSTFARVGVELAVIGACLQCALPFAVALFPQTGSIDASALEPSFHSLVSPVSGQRVSTLYFNKGV